MNAAAFGANLRDKIKAGTMTNAQAQAAHNAFVKQQMSPRAQAAAENASATLRAAKPRELPTQSQQSQQAMDMMNRYKDSQQQGPSGGALLGQMRKAVQDYQSDKGSSGGNLLGALRPGLGGVPPSQSPTQTGSQQPQVSRLPGMTAPKSSMTAPKSSAPYMPTATAPTGPAPAGPVATPGAAMRMKKGGKVSKPVKKMAKGGSTASSRGDGCAVRGKTKGMMR
jgi:hypothetical protein